MRQNRHIHILLLSQDFLTWTTLSFLFAVSDLNLPFQIYQQTQQSYHYVLRCRDQASTIIYLDFGILVHLMFLWNLLRAPRPLLRNWFTKYLWLSQALIIIVLLVNSQQYLMHLCCLPYSKYQDEYLMLIY